MCIRDRGGRWAAQLLAAIVEQFCCSWVNLIVVGDVIKRALLRVGGEVLRVGTYAVLGEVIPPSSDAVKLVARQTTAVFKLESWAPPR
eukprot:4989925-Alexandrium_andersonii.AAC.1